MNLLSAIDTFSQDLPKHTMSKRVHRDQSTFRSQLRTSLEVVSEPIACPKPTADTVGLQNSLTYDESVQHYNMRTWAMFYRIMNSRKTQTKVVCEKQKDESTEKPLATRCEFPEKRFDRQEYQHMADDIFPLEM